MEAEKTVLDRAGAIEVSSWPSMEPIHISDEK